MPTRLSARLIALAGSLALAAPAGAVVVSGRVLGESGAPVANVNLDFVDSTGVSIPLVGDLTDLGGAYAIDVPLDTYDIVYKAPFGSGWAHAALRSVVVGGATALPDVILPYGFLVEGYLVDPLGLPVVGADLDFYDCATGEQALTLSDDTDGIGFYSVVVPAGTWTIAYDPPQGDRHAAVVVPCVTVSGPTIRPDVTCPDAFIVTARVLDPALAPVRDANTVWYDAAGNPVRTNYDTSDATGTWAVAVAAGTYDIEVRPPAGTRLLPITLTGIVVAADRTLPDIVLQAGWFVDGRVVSRGGAPIPDVDTDWSTPAGTLLTPGDNTDAAGAFAVVLPADTYAAAFEPAPGSRYAARIVADIAIAADTTLPDTILETAWFVTGRVVDAGGAPVSDANTRTLDAATGGIVPTTRDHADAAGEYLLALADGTYDVVYDPPAGSLLGSARVSDLVVAGADLRLPDVVLPRGYVLSGRVVNRAAAPVDLVDVVVTDPSTGLRVPTPGSDLTDAAGAYAVRIPAGTWDVTWAPPAPYAPVTITGLVLASDLVRPDVVLDRAFLLSGDVADPAGLPVAGAVMRATDPVSGTALAADAVTGADGSFSLRLREGDVRLATTPGPASGLARDTRDVVLAADLDVGTISLAALLQGLAPTTGSTGGGDNLALTGTDFDPAMTATLGGMPAAVSNVTATSATLTTGPHPAAVVDLEVQWPDGRVATLRSCFEYTSAAPAASIRVVKDAGDVVLSWTEAPGTLRTIFGSPAPDSFGAGSLLGTTTGTSFRDALAISRRGTIHYIVQ